MLEAFRIKLTLRGVSPLIWRRLIVPSNITLTDLHHTIQFTMNWSGDFLYAFRLHGKDYSSKDPNASESASETLLKALPLRLRERFLYKYNYFSNWQFDIRIEKALSEDALTAYPKLIAGSGHPPPENIGGAHSYMQWLDEQYSWDNLKAIDRLNETMHPILEALLADDDERLTRVVQAFRNKPDVYYESIEQLENTIWLDSDYIYHPKTVNENLQTFFANKKT